MAQCKNCREQIDSKFCPYCGQKANLGRISLSSFLKDLPHAIFHIDRGFLYNFIQLFKRPGSAILEYLDGKRKPYFHPASYLVIALVFNYLVVKLTDLHLYDEQELVSMSALEAKAITDYDAMQWWFLEHTYIYILLAIPASCLFLFLVFKGFRQKYNVAETAVIVMFTIAQGVLIQSMIYLCFGWIDSGPFLRTMETVNMAILILYASYVVFHLLPGDKSKIVRSIFAGIGGLGLAVVWIASAYLLYIMLT